MKGSLNSLHNLRPHHSVPQTTCLGSLLTLPLAGWLIWGKLFNFSELQFSHVWNGITLESKGCYVASQGVAWRHLLSSWHWSVPVINIEAQRAFPSLLHPPYQVPFSAAGDFSPHRTQETPPIEILRSLFLRLSGLFENFLLFLCLLMILLPIHLLRRPVSTLPFTSPQRWLCDLGEVLHLYGIHSRLQLKST